MFKIRFEQEVMLDFEFWINSVMQLYTHKKD